MSSTLQPIHTIENEPPELDKALPWHMAEAISCTCADRFQDEFLLALIKRLRAQPKSGLGALQSDLRTLCQQFMIAAHTSPLGLAKGPARKTLDQRARWLRTNAIAPTQRLIEALTKEAHMFSEWPETFDAPPPDRAVLLDQLQRLHSRSSQILADIEDRKRDGNEGPTTVKAELANALTGIFTKHFPQLPAVRSPYDRSGDKKLRSEYAVFIARCTKEVFGGELSIPGNLIDDASKIQGMT